METLPLEIGAMGVIFFFAIKEFFSYLKSKKNGGGLDKQILDELQSQSNNHLSHLQGCMEAGFEGMINRLDDIKEVLIRMDERDKNR
jgi:hypothetical protein